MGVAANFKLRPRKCIACGGTGVSSRGTQCYPCKGEGTFPWFRCNGCNRILNSAKVCPKCGGTDSREIR